MTYDHILPKYLLVCLNRLSWIRKSPKQLSKEVIYGWENFI